MKKLTIKDLMTVGMYAALYFIHVAIGTFVGVILIHSGNMMLSPAMVGLIAGTVYLLLVNRVQKFGAISLVGVVMATFFFLSGHFILSFIPSLICGVLADFVAYLGKYKHKILNIMSYIIFSLGNMGPIIFMWLAKEAYIQRLVEKGKDMTYIDNVMVPFDIMHIVLVCIASFLGGLFGQYLIHKHFRKAGLVK